MKDIIDMSRHRGYFIDQSQSLNLFMENASYAKLTSMHFYAWKSGLKTGMYYLRTKSAVDAIKFTLSKEDKKEQPKGAEALSTTTIDADGALASAPAPEPKAQLGNSATEQKPMTAQEFKDMMNKSQNGGPDEDCLMCGS